MTEQLELDKLPGTQKILLKTLLTHGPLFRCQIVELTGLSRTTAYENLQKLIGKNLVNKTGKNNSLPGRNRVIYNASIPKKIKPVPKSRYPIVPKSEENLFIFYATRQEIRKIKQMRGIDA